jgi:hypothetical protein
MIFDSFPSREKAEKCASEIRLKFHLKVTIHDSQYDSDREEPFMFGLDPPIVVVKYERGNLKEKKKICKLASRYGGIYSGT